MFKKVLKDLESKKNNKQAVILSRFFKTGKGQYGEGDIFWGIKVPDQRITSKKFKELPLKDIQNLLDNKVHEVRLTGLFILIERYNISDNKKEIFDFYLKNTRNINNWDLVDLSAPKILGDFLINNSKETKVLYNLVKSDNLWERRIAILSTFTFIKNNNFEETLKIAEILLKDEHDLIHKSVGWMLREVGKKDKDSEKDFLNKYYRIMPRTMLRYSIEKFDSKEKEFYMKK
ncbi:MAG: DNA alkylation repair protein [Candidatus Pacebacteria bacterium]|nr:DNA alkylation repair protein [Candidatus Paceibacterota bacterium]